MRSGDALGGSTPGEWSPACSLRTEATPALVVDRDLLIANVAAMAERARNAGVAMWPHAKTHKTAQIAALQRQHGAAGVTVATIVEAEYFAAEGFDDILLAYPPVGDWRLARLTDLARRARLRVVLDDAGVLAELIEACRAAGVVIGYLWEVDCGTGRLGTAPGEATATAVAGAPRGPECPFQGLMTFGGHAYAAADDTELDRAAEDERAALKVSAEILRGAGIDCPVRSAGTTPTAHRMGAGTAPTITEIRPGNYVFYDATQVALGLIGPPGCALTVLATVIGRPGPRRVILDSGSKALSAERLTPRAPGFGLVLGHPELTVERLYEQHAIVSASHATELLVGERVRIIPNHACTTANLHRRALVAEGDEVVDVWSIGAAGPGG